MVVAQASRGHEDLALPPPPPPTRFQGYKAELTMGGFPLFHTSVRAAAGEDR